MIPLLEYLEKYSNLKKEFESFKISGERHAAFINQHPDEQQLVMKKYEEHMYKIAHSNIPDELKERYLEEVNESLGYLSKNGNKLDQNPDIWKYIVNIAIALLSAIPSFFLGMKYEQGVRERDERIAKYALEELFGKIDGDEERKGI